MWTPAPVFHNTRLAETIPDVLAVKPSDSSELNVTFLSHDVMEWSHPKLASNSSRNGVLSTALLT